MDVAIIAGSPATGKTTVANGIRERLQCAVIELSTFRNMYLDRDWSRANPQEAQMSFVLACHTAREFVAHGIKPVLLLDLRPEHIGQLAEQFAGVNYGIVTLFVSARQVLAERMAAPTRDSGFRDLEQSWAWNVSETSRALLPREVRLDTTGLTIDETVGRVLEIISG